MGRKKNTVAGAEEVVIPNTKIQTYKLLRRAVLAGARIEIDSTGSDDNEIEFEVTIDYRDQGSVSFCAELDEAVEEAYHQIRWPKA